MATYEIRRSGTVILRSSIVDCGYTGETLKDMARAGLHLYCDGKKVKKPPPGVQDRKTELECPNTPRITELGGNVKWKIPIN